MSDLDAVLAAREARKAQLAATKAEQRKRDMLKLDELEQREGDDNVRPLWTPAGLVVLRRPTLAECQRFEEAVAQDGKRAEKAQRQVAAIAKLGRPCVIHPEASVLESWCEEFGGLPTQIGKAAAEFAAIVLEEEAGK